jgi:hypothetical protein
MDLVRKSVRVLHLCGEDVDLVPPSRQLPGEEREIPFAAPGRKKFVEKDGDLQRPAVLFSFHAPLTLFMQV